ncbi:MAG: hypothetical protein M1834_004691 [Cirrosporium novae-zelandiae]|nr:MAG: hypothetical protein M1834_004691 [Cirrosporium novae-zelandiae]
MHLLTLIFLALAPVNFASQFRRHHARDSISETASEMIGSISCAAQGLPPCGGLYTCCDVNDYCLMSSNGILTCCSLDETCEGSGDVMMADISEPSLPVFETTFIDRLTLVTAGRTTELVWVIPSGAGVTTIYPPSTSSSLLSISTISTPPQVQWSFPSAGYEPNTTSMPPSTTTSTLPSYTSLPAPPCPERESIPYSTDLTSQIPQPQELSELESINMVTTSTVTVVYGAASGSEISTTSIETAESTSSVSMPIFTGGASEKIGLQKGEWWGVVEVAAVVGLMM